MYGSLTGGQCIIATPNESTGEVPPEQVGWPSWSSLRTINNGAAPRVLPFNSSPVQNSLPIPPQPLINAGGTNCGSRWPQLAFMWSLIYCGHSHNSSSGLRPQIFFLWLIKSCAFWPQQTVAPYWLRNFVFYDNKIRGRRMLWPKATTMFKVTEPGQNGHTRQTELCHNFSI